MKQLINILYIFLCLSLSAPAFAETTRNGIFGSKKVKTSKSCTQGKIARAGKCTCPNGHNPMPNKKGATCECPAGKGPMQTRTCNPALQKKIASVVGKAKATCYGKLIMSESGCNLKVYHDKKKAFNPYEGIGLCAFEKSPVVRQQNGRGPNCVKLTTFEQQVRCCKDIVEDTQGRYFGTMKCGKTPRC